MLTKADLKVGNVYSAKRPRKVQPSFFHPDEVYLNDRQIRYINLLSDVVQYDSVTVDNGRHYPKVSIDAFLRWAAEDVTDKMPDETWRRAT
jgi:hypothetical protein